MVVMAKELSNLYTKKEHFELLLNIENSSLSTQDLISYLSNIDKLIQSINDTLNYKYSIGYDQILVDVIAFEKGSFKIPLSIKKITKNPLFVSITGTLIGGIAANLFTNNIDTYKVYTPTESVTVANKDFLENNTTKKSIECIAMMAVEKDSIKDIAITYEKDNGDCERITINKETLSQLRYEAPTEDLEQLSNIQEHVKLEIVSPVFIEKPAAWKVLYNNETISAQMVDKDFLETMNTQKIAFAKGDIIVADLEFVAINTEQGIKIKQYIKKVYSYPKYTKIIRQNTQEKSLFD